MHLTLGGVLFFRGRHVDATRHLSVACALRPDSLEAHHRLGKVYDARAMRDEAIRAYEKALAVDPDWEQLPPTTPPAVRRLLRRCLTREVDKRLSHISGARAPLREIVDGAADNTDGAVVAQASIPVPVRDGMAIAAGRLYLSTLDGRVVCLGGE